MSYDIMRHMDAETLKRNDTPKNFLNPLPDPIDIEYFDDDNKVIKTTIPSRQLISLPTYLADLYIRRIIDAIVIARGIKYATPEIKDELLSEIIL